MWGKWGKPIWLISDTNQFHLNVIYASIVRLWQMQKGPVGGIWEIAAIESVEAIGACFLIWFAWGQTKY